MKRFIILTTLILWVVLAGFCYYYVNRPMSDVNNKKADYKLESTALYDQFEKNEEVANSKYLDKVIELSGIITQIATDENGGLSVELKGNDMFGVNCKLNDDNYKLLSAVQKGSEIKVKGVCSGKLMDVVLVNCTIENN